jgi:parvulin-like peptidyl-prolyl isomerase
MVKLFFSIVFGKLTSSYMEEQSTIKKIDQPAKWRSLIKMMIFGVVTAVVVILICLLIVFTVGVYRWHWQGPMTRGALEVLPYPAALVNNQSIKYSDYLEDVDTLKRFFAAQLADGVPAESIPDEQEMHDNALKRLIFTTVLEQEAKKRGLKVSPEEIDKEYKTLVDQSGGEEKLQAELQDLYGWGAEQFKQKVLSMYLLQNKLAEALAADETLNNEAKSKADGLLNSLKEGADFEELAKTNSADLSSGAEGGDLGWFGRGVMVDEFEQAAFALAPGELSAVVKTQFGFHIIRVDDVEKKDAEVTRVKARHILIETISVEKYIDQLMNEAQVKKYVD